MHKKDPGPVPAGYHWSPSNCRSMSTWDEELARAQQEGYELVPPDEDIPYGGERYFTLRDAGFDECRVGGMNAGRLGYPVYRLRIDNKDSIRDDLYPVLEWPFMGESLHAEVGITPDCIRINRYLWWDEEKQAYVGDGYWVMRGEDVKRKDFILDHNLAEQTDFRIKVSPTSILQHDSISHQDRKRRARHTRLLNKIFNENIGVWEQHGVSINVNGGACIEGYSYTIIPLSGEFDVTDNGHDQDMTQEMLVSALRFYAGEFDGGLRASQTLKQLGFPISV